MTVRRGTSNADARGSTATRRRRRQWLVDTYRADVDLATVLTVTGRVSVVIEVGVGSLLDTDWHTREKACRCYRCGRLLTVDTVTVDRITPGCKRTAEYPNGGTYVRKNIRPACGRCNSETGGALASRPKKRRKATA